MIKSTMFTTMAALAGTLALAACSSDGRSGGRAPSAGTSTPGMSSAHAGMGEGLSRFPGAEEQIKSYYASHDMNEQGYNCGRGSMDSITDSRVVSETPSQVTLAVSYTFSASTLQGGSSCTGINTRQFTFNKGPGGAVSLASASGSAV